MLENLSAHKAPAVAKWLAHPRTKRWHLHFTPTSCSWLNLVEGVVQTAHRPAAPPRNLHQCRCSHRGHCSVNRALEPRPQTLPMAQDRRRHNHQGPPRPNRPHPPNQIRDTPLGRGDVYGDGMPGPTAAQPSETEFAAVLTGARAGSGRELRRIYDWLSPTLAGYLRSQGLPDAEAAANETFFRAFTRLDQFRGAASGFKSWIFTIAHNIVIDERRRTARRPRTDPTGETRDLERPGPDSETEALTHLGLQAVMAMLSGLTNAQRDVVFLRVIAGLSVAETAKVIGRPSGAVKALQHRGLTALRQRLAADPVTETDSSTFPTLT